MRRSALHVLKMSSAVLACQMHINFDLHNKSNYVESTFVDIYVEFAYHFSHCLRVYVFRHVRVCICV